MSMWCSAYTGKGFDLAMGGSWQMVFVGVVIVAAIIILLRRWYFEETGTPFNFLAGLVLGIWLDTVFAGMFCSYKIGLVAGLVGGIGGGYLVGNMGGGE